jgi:membrane associated rhomboid family serine protease
MILCTVIEIVTARIPARSRRQAMDWSLVLISQGIETTIDFAAELGWGLIMPTTDQERALSILKQYQAENRHWHLRQRIPVNGALFDWASLGWVFLIGAFFWTQTHAGPQFQEAGLMDAVAVSHGQWWRLFTAIYLHADLGHFAMNASLGLFLLGLTMGKLGRGFGLLAAYLAGAGGNVATWLIYSDGHRSLGASGMVMGCVGLLAAQAIFAGAVARHRWKYAVGGIAAGAMLFTSLGLSPGSDVLAHLGGFASGTILGCLLNAVPRLRQNAAADLFAGVIFCLLTALPWWLALNAARIP